MRSRNGGEDTRTRVLEAAVERFGQDGFGAPLRAIAADAGLSAPAIIKHFGSKDGLHRACDDHVLARVRAYKQEAMRSPDLGATFLAQMAVLDEVQPLVRYLVRSFLAGGEAARHLVEEMRTEALTWMRDGVEAGHLRPSRNEELRVKFAFSVSIGWMVQSVLSAGAEIGELGSQFWERTLKEMMLPALEVYTEGLLTDRALLDQYLLYMSDPPSPA
jgi:AcrR family transcriptional regulator